VKAVEVEDFVDVEYVVLDGVHGVEYGIDELRAEHRREDGHHAWRDVEVKRPANVIRDSRRLPVGLVQHQHAEPWQDAVGLFPAEWDELPARGRSRERNNANQRDTRRQKLRTHRRASA
jgi:hypothetical protein